MLPKFAWKYRNFTGFWPCLLPVQAKCMAIHTIIGKKPSYYNVDLSLPLDQHEVRGFTNTILDYASLQISDVKSPVGPFSIPTFSTKINGKNGSPLQYLLSIKCPRKHWKVIPLKCYSWFRYSIFLICQIKTLRSLFKNG